MKLAIISDLHTCLDDRNYFHFAKSAINANNSVLILSSVENFEQKELNCTIKGIKSNSIVQKYIFFKQHLNTFCPDVVIASSPLLVIFLSLFKLILPFSFRIIYDVTEWYPRPILRTVKDWILFVPKLILNYLAVVLVHKLILGEVLKLKPFKLFLREKNYIVLPYYPSLKYFNCMQEKEQLLTITYAGPFTTERGFDKVLEVLQMLKNMKLENLIKVQLIGGILNNATEIYENSSVYPSVSYPEYCKLLSHTDIALDLRPVNWEHNNGLPIKLFQYMAVGAVCIYSELKSIKCEFPKFNTYGHLINPNATDSIVELILYYKDNLNQLLEKKNNATAVILNEKNWQKQENKFLTFIGCENATKSPILQ